MKNLNLATAEAEETDFEETIFALGRIRVAPGHRAVVSSRVPGRVLSVSAHIDTRIEKGAEALRYAGACPLGFYDAPSPIVFACGAPSHNL